MKFFLLTLALAAAITLAGMPDTEAASKSQPSPEPTVPERASRPLPFNGKIFAVDNVAKTFSTQNKEKKIRTYAITPETKLTKKEAPAKFEDLKIGDEVRGMAIPKGNGQFETESVIIGPREQLAPAATPSPTPPSAAPIPKTTPKPHKKSPTPTPTAKEAND